MIDINLAYKAYDVHELLCHGIAEEGGIQDQVQGVGPVVRDIRSVDYLACAYFYHEVAQPFVGKYHGIDQYQVSQIFVGRLFILTLGVSS